MDAATLELLGKQAPGARRDLLVFPQELTANVESDGAVVLEFGYPAGAYATGLVAEFTHAAFGKERASDGEGAVGESGVVAESDAVTESSGGELMNEAVDED